MTGTVFLKKSLCVHKNRASPLLLCLFTCRWKNKDGLQLL